VFREKESHYKGKMQTLETKIITKKFYARCGLCNKNFATKSGCDKHFNSEIHLRRLARWYELGLTNKNFGSILDNMTGNAKEVIAEEMRPEVVDFT
jgi:hypothetical protein